ncbi:MAG: inositol phosphorylceramide synthase [Sphingobacteriales bacterium]|nr:MAG: inositol phosphorylceramide synthase [Sphingobacteriales bacterium]
MDNTSVIADIKYTGWQRVLIMTGISIGYLLLSYVLIGFRPEQLILLGLINFFYFFSKTSRKFLIGFSIFIIYWVTFDYMKAMPNYLFGRVHIAELYNLEKSLFGISAYGVTISPNEYWLMHSNTVLDVITGLFYLCWIPVPLGFATYLFYKNRQQFFYFSLTFLLVNFLGYIVYYIYPAAPPWYMQQYGVEFIQGTPGNTAGLARFDAFFGASVFKGLYQQSSNVFAAMPSLHSAYPVIVIYYGLKNRLGIVNVFFATVMTGIWFAAVYTSHHYVLDVLAGITCAISGIALFGWLRSLGRIKKGIDKLIKYTY